MIRLDPESPHAGQEWTLSLLIDHPNPHEVTVIAPDFPESFFLDRVLKSARLITQGDTAGRWTEAEYRIISHTPGSFTIDPFTAITPGSRISTGQLAVIVRNVGIDAVMFQPRLEWDGVPSRLCVGEPGIFNLKISGWDGHPLPNSHVFMPALNESFIMEVQEPHGSDVLCLKITPLAVHDLHIPARTVVYNTVTLEIPALGVSVSPQPIPVHAATGTTAEQTQAPAFPEFELPPYAGFFSRLVFGIDIFRTDYESVYRCAADLFNQGCYAEALSLLRRNERDHAAFSLFASVRRQTEETIDIYNTHNEKPQKLIKNLYLFFCAVVLILCTLFFIRGTGRNSKLALAIVFCAVSVWLFGSGFLPVAVHPAVGLSRPAVVRDTELRQIPDFSGEPHARLKAGQPVRVFRAREKNQDTERSTQASWVRIITRDADRMSGWIPEDRAVFY
jgi:hypothetical protein